MIADEVVNPDYIPRFLWKQLIDESHQRRRFATATLDLVDEFIRDRGVGELWTRTREG